MRYPQFLKSNSIIGVSAVSCGIGDRISDYEKSIETLKSQSYQILETESVRNKGFVSNTSIIRGKEFNNIYDNEKVDMVMCATGGDFCLDILPYIDFEIINNNPKWIQGASDPTSILYVVTTALDIATIYGLNSTSYDDYPLHDCQSNNLEILKGNIVKQNSFAFYEKDKNFNSNKRNLTSKVKWEAVNGDFKAQGRIIGGCIDVLRNLIGTPYDYTKEFIKKYENDGIIWYFDIFSLSSEDFYLTLYQMNLAGWFKNIKAVVIGRVMFPQRFNDDFDYKDAALKIFGKIPIIMEADIGHVFPKMTIINGSMATIEFIDNKGSIQLELR